MSDLLWSILAIIGGCTLIRLAWKQLLKLGGEREPSCFGSNPGPQQKAENGCHDCPWRGHCMPPPRRSRGREAPTPWAAPMPETPMLGDGA